MIERFLALDMQGSVHVLALCETSDGVDALGWPVRAALRVVHACEAHTAGGSVHPWDEIERRANQWQLPLSDVPLAVLSNSGRESACTQLPQARTIVIPRYRYAISPRGIVMAEQFRDYSRDLPPGTPTTAALKQLFAPLLEQAADDVQAAGFEQDDCIVDRYLRVHCDGRTALAAIESLTDQAWITSSIAQAWRITWDEPLPERPLEWTRIYVRCPVEPPGVFPAPLASTDGHVKRALEPAASVQLPSYARSHLLAGDAGCGPVCINDGSYGIAVPAGRHWHVNTMGQLLCCTHADAS